MSKKVEKSYYFQLRGDRIKINLQVDNSYTIKLNESEEIEIKGNQWMYTIKSTLENKESNLILLLQNINDSKEKIKYKYKKEDENYRIYNGFKNYEAKEKVINFLMIINLFKKDKLPIKKIN